MMFSYLLCTGIGLFVFLVFVGFYVIGSLSYVKALRYLGYANPWMAWIPILNCYAMADCVTNDNEDVYVVGQIRVPGNIFKFWWLSFFICVIPFIGQIATFVIMILCLATVYSKMYARIEGKSESDTLALGIVSAFIGIVPVIKFLQIRE